MLIFFLFHIFYFLACFFVVNFHFNSFSFIDRIISSFLIFISSIVLSITILSYLNILSFSKLLLLLIFFLILLFISCFKEIKKWKKIISEIFSSLKGFIKETKGILLYIFFILNFLNLTFIIYYQAMFPPFGYDTYSYHLPVVSKIIQDKGFGIYDAPPSIFSSYNIFPKNAEFLFAHVFLFFKTDRFIEIIQLPFIYFSAFSIYSISRHLKIPKKFSIWAFSFPLIPIVVQQSITCYVDVIFSSFVIMTINFILKRKPFYLLFSIISASLALGTKGTGIPFFIIIMILIVILNFREIFNKSKILKYIFIFLFLFFSLGGHFYIRNIVLFKSPVGEIEVFIGRIKIIKGKYPLEGEKRKIIPSIFESPSINEKHLGYYLYDTRAGGFGPLFTILFLPAIFFGLIKGILKRDNEILILFLVLISTYILLPNKWWTRFHIYFAGISIIFFVYLIQDFEKFSPIFILLLIFSFIPSYTNIIKFHIQNYFPYECRRLYFSPFNKLMGKIKDVFLPEIKKDDLILFYHAPGAKERYYRLTELSYNFMLPDFSVYHRYVYSLEKNEVLKRANWLITPDFVESVPENYRLIYKDNDLKIWKKE